MAGDTAKQLIIAGAATEVAERAVDLKDFLACLTDNVDDLHWWTVCYSLEWEALLEAVERYEEVCI